MHLIEDDICHERLGADGAAVVDLAPLKDVRVLMEDAALAEGGAHFLAHAEEHGDVLKAVEAIGDEEGHDDDIGRGGEFGPLGDERGLLHISVDDFGEAVVAAANEGDLILDGLGGVFVEAGAVADDDEAGLLPCWGGRPRDRSSGSFCHCGAW